MIVFVQQYIEGNSTNCTRGRCSERNHSLVSENADAATAADNDNDVDVAARSLFIQQFWCLFQQSGAKIPGEGKDYFRECVDRANHFLLGRSLSQMTAQSPCVPSAGGWCIYYHQSDVHECIIRLINAPVSCLLFLANCS